MTYTSGNPGHRTAQQKLADKRWRYINSWWIFPPILSFGFLGWLGFLMASARTGNKKYRLFSAIYAACFVAFMIMILNDPNDGVMSDLAAIPFLGAWLVPTIHASILNREYLTTLASKGDWYRTPEAQSDHSAATPGPAPFLGVNQNDYYAPQTGPSTPPQATYPQPAPSPAPRSTQAVPPANAPVTRQYSNPTTAPGRVHANTATVDNLSGLPGVSPALAQRIVTVRDARGGYRDIDDLASAANLQPHELIRLRNHLTFEQDTQPNTHINPQQHGATGRILDI